MPLQEDEKGTAIRFRYIRDGAVADIGDATTKEVWAKPPGGSWTSYACTFATDGEDGIIQHIFSAAELATPGVWYTQGFVELADWSKWSKVESFLVRQNKP